ncbi:hypothetical protein CGRA01v4_06364 [Colletotrichum graminicola]|uniref:Cell wall protein n=2 Tax=Colletotrichum graminicola TaxID=31870 RepID=E3Q2H1_COLGM|nr:uncharacterized protein GLRG_00416 [Colletotrichum graminicola M1.001]EFQ25272.1 hypothetical protein GLRG_00416 [Colletotrichum graminicola M1.001]WDK15083.1 hypothetical protein CGRA01v4_06364 [Colletotrichum graminicola]
MQARILPAILTALSLTSVDAAILPRATITPGVIVLPEVVFNPSELFDPAYTALNIFRNDLLKTTTLVSDLTRTAGTTVKDRTDQVNAVIRQVTSNTNNIRTRVGYIIGNLQGVVPSGIPAPTGTAAPPAAPTAEVFQVAQDIVRQAQALARTATSQLQSLQTQTDAVVDATGKAAYTLAFTQAKLALDITLTTVAATAKTIIDAVANSVDNVNGIAERVRNVKFKLDPVLVIGVTPDVTF